MILFKSIAFKLTFSDAVCIVLSMFTFEVIKNTRIEAEQAIPLWVWVEVVNNEPFVFCYGAALYYNPLSNLKPINALLTINRVPQEEQIKESVRFSLKYGALHYNFKDFQNVQVAFAKMSPQETTRKEVLQYIPAHLYSYSNQCNRAGDLAILLLKEHQLRKRLERAVKHGSKWMDISVIEQEESFASMFAEELISEESSLKIDLKDLPIVPVIGESVKDFIVYSFNLEQKLKSFGEFSDPCALNDLTDEVTDNSKFYFAEDGTLRFSIPYLYTAMCFKLVCEVVNRRLRLEYCKHCKGLYIPNHPSQRFCSTTCRVKHFHKERRGG